MNFFTCKIDNIREKIITMQPSTAVSLLHCFIAAIGEEELSKLVNSSISTTCML